MTAIAIVGWLTAFALACLGDYRIIVRQRQIDALTELCYAQRSALMLEMEQNAELLACSAKLLAASNALHDAVSAQTIIVPPAGGMVA
jgi:hypothetical protein